MIDQKEKRYLLGFFVWFLVFGLSSSSLLFYDIISEVYTFQVAALQSPRARGKGRGLALAGQLQMLIPSWEKK